MYSIQNARAILFNEMCLIPILTPVQEQIGAPTSMKNSIRAFVYCRDQQFSLCNLPGNIQVHRQRAHTLRSRCTCEDNRMSSPLAMPLMVTHCSQYCGEYVPCNSQTKVPTRFFLSVCTQRRRQLLDAREVIEFLKRYETCTLRTFGRK